MSSYLDIHTHLNSTEENVVSIKNLSSNFNSTIAEQFYSIGLHPWYIDAESFENQFLQLKQIAFNKEVLAIGECGLDKRCKTNMDLQKKCFVSQVQLAQSIRKPLVIHSVKAYDETIKILQQEAFNLPVVFHGFNSKIELAEKLIDKGYYLSFGRHILSERMPSVFKKIPLSSVFFESDTANVSMKLIYEQAAFLKSIEIEKLSAQIRKNAILVFGEKIFRNDA